GNPVVGYYHSGRLEQFSAAWDPSQGDKFTLRGYDAEKPRHVYFVHQARQLAGHAIIEGELTDARVVTLQPSGKVTGRLVDKEGAPLPNCQLVPYYPAMPDPRDRALMQKVPPLPHNRAKSSSAEYETDDEGRFEIAGLAPGVAYQLRAFDRESMEQARQRAPKFSGPLEVTISVEPGETKDLGDVRVIDEAEPADQLEKRSDKQAQAALPQQTITGAVTLPDGQPAAGAHVAVVAMRKSVPLGGTQRSPDADVVEGLTDATGGFSLEMAGASSETHHFVQLVARMDGYGIAWEKVNLDEVKPNVALQLAAEQPIRAQLVDLEGQPLAGVDLQVQSVAETTAARFTEDRIWFGAIQAPRAWLSAMRSDVEGRFTVRGVPVGYGVHLETKGDNRIAPQGIALNTGQPEEPRPQDQSYRSLTRNSKNGEELVLPLAPAQLFEGQITYADTGEPAPHARVSIWASQHEHGSMTSVAVEADDEGRYSINPNPGIRFGVSAYPNAGVPYLVRTTPLEEPIRWRDGDIQRQVDLSLPRGVLVRGSIRNSETGAPIPGASIQYEPESDNNLHTSDDVLTGWQNIQGSDEEGRFEIGVLPGPGRLVVHAPTQEFVVQSISSRRLSAGKEGGSRIRA
ncbi:MAG: hypothetical protein AAF961_10060, partial [Planctomycetota bacterium]